MKQRNILQSTLFLVLITAPSVVHAQVRFGDNLSSYVTNFYNWSIGFGLALAILMFVYAGYIMVTSAGDPGRVGFAKEIIVGSLAGITLLVAARLVLNLLSVTS